MKRERELAFQLPGILECEEGHESRRPLLVQFAQAYGLECGGPFAQRLEKRYIPSASPTPVHSGSPDVASIIGTNDGHVGNVVPTVKVVS